MQRTETAFSLLEEKKELHFYISSHEQLQSAWEVGARLGMNGNWKIIYGDTVEKSKSCYNLPLSVRAKIIDLENKGQIKGLSYLTIIDLEYYANH